MERTRDEVVRLLHEQGPLTVSGLARALGLSEGSVRRHLDIMSGEGLVDASLERQPRGRPATRYALSEAGEDRTASPYYARLLDRLQTALLSLQPEEIEGRDGHQLVDLLFERAAEEMARMYAPRVRAEELSTRVGRVASALHEEGILNEVVDEGQVFRLRNVGCPFRSAAEDTHAACSADRHVIELLLGEPVEQLTTIVDGSPTCEYLVQKTALTERPTRTGPPAGAVSGVS